MKYCNHCHIDANTEGRVCPICNSVLVEKEGSEVAPPNGYPKFEGVKKHAFAIKLFAFLSIIATIVCGFINYKTFNPEEPVYWSIVVFVAILYCWGLGKIFSNKKISFVTRYFYLTLFTSAFIMCVEFCLTLFNVGEDMSWSLTYVFPCLLIAALLVVQIVGYASRRNFGDCIFICFYLALLTVIPYLLYVFAPSYVHVEWPPVAGILTAFATLVGFFVFRFRRTKEEFVKRFNM